ncbi:MAG: cytochrome c oxidase subunit [Acidimicrobiaceae bacterium]
MAMTETRPETAEVAPAPGGPPPEPATPRTDGGLLGVFGTGDHLVIGRLWISASIVFLLVSGVAGVLLGVERFDTTHYNVLDGKNYAQTLSLHGVSGVFLFLLPALLGVATIVVPRQVGASTIAFPRAAAAAFWAYLIGGGMVVTSYLINGGPFGGNDKGVDLFLASLALVVVALGLASVCVATTVLALRVPGLTLDRAPAFAWSVLVAAVIWIATLGLLFGLLVLLYVDHRYRVFSVGSNFQIDGWLRWTVTQPTVYAAGIPVLGFAADVVPVFSRNRLRHHGVVIGAIGAFSALSFGAWTFAQFGGAETTQFAPELTKQALYIGVAVAALLPLLVIAGGLADTVRRGSIRIASPLLFAISALLMLLAGVAAGAVRVVTPLDLVGTTADSSVAHYVLGAATIAVIGAVHYWWPQIVTRPLKEGLGLLTAGLLLLGTIALSLPDLISGFLDEPHGSLLTQAPRDGVEALNVVSFIGGVLLLLGVLVFVVNLASSLARRGSAVETDPWDGFTLEWAADAGAVTVASAAPLLDAREGLLAQREDLLRAREGQS